MNRPCVLGLAGLCLFALLLTTGCGSNSTNSKDDGPPAFTLSWSEYPSWSVFAVAVEEGLIDLDPHKLGTIEKKWNVKIKLAKEQDYGDCLTKFANKTVDGVCMTNMDALIPAVERKSVAILPTSTSDGSDALIVLLDTTDKAKALEELKKVEVWGLEKSVSQYAFVRLLQKNGKKPEEYTYKRMENVAAAAAMQNGQKGKEAIMVWNPEVIQTLKKRKEARRLFDSSEIPEEIIDMVVVGQDVLDKKGGEDFACAVIDTYYEFNRMLNDASKRDDLLVKVGKHLSGLNKDEMAQACKETRFYDTPEKGLALLTGDKFRTNMENVKKFWVENKYVTAAPTLGYGDGAKDTQLRFDATYIKKVQDRK